MHELNSICPHLNMIWLDFIAGRHLDVLDVLKKMRRQNHMKL